MDNPFRSWQSLFASLGLIPPLLRSRKPRRQPQRFRQRRALFESLEPRVVLDGDPVASDDYFRVDTNTPFLLNAPGVLGNDTYESGNTISAVLDTGPGSGTFDLFASGAVEFTPPTDFSGDLTFTYHIYDETAETYSNSATATLHVNLSPTATNDSFSGGGSISGNVLTNDSDPESDSIVVTTSGSFYTSNGGYVTLEATGSFNYSAASNFNGSDSFDYSISDGHGGAASATASIEISGNYNYTNQAPIISVPGPQTVGQNEDFVFASTSANPISIADADANGNPVQVSLSVDCGTLALSGSTGLTFEQNGPSGYSALTFTGTLANINAALENLAYTPPTNFLGDVTLTIGVDDLGNTGLGGSQTDSETVSISVVYLNVGPSASVPGAQSIDEDQPLVFSTATSNTITISDPDAGNDDIEATFTVTGGVILVGTSNVTVEGNESASVVITGSQTQINAALEGMTFTPTAHLNGTAAGLIQIDIDDLGHSGHGGSRTGANSVTINIAPINDAPTLFLPSDQSILEDGTLTFSSAGNGISIADVDAGSNSVQVSLWVDSGTLALSGSNGLTFTQGGPSGHSALTFTGTQSAINAALNGLVYTAPSEFSGQVSLSVGVNDLGSSGSGGPQTASGSVLIDISSVNDPPTISVPGAQIASQNGELTFSAASGNAITVADVDAFGADVQLSLSVDSGTLEIPDPTGLTFTAGQAAGFSAMTFTGTLSAINAALNGLIYIPEADFTGTVSLSLGLDDFGNSGGGGNQSSSNSVSIGVVYFNVGPFGILPGSQNSLEDAPLVFSTATANPIAMSDPDAGDDDVQVAFTVSGGVVTVGTEDVTVTGNGTASVTVTGSITHINAALEGMIFTPTANLNGVAAAELQINFDDLGHSGFGGNQTGSGSVTINLTPVNDAPSFTGGNNLIVSDDAGAISLTGWATNLARGPSDEGAQALSFEASAADTSLFSVQPTIDADGTLVFTPASGAFGTTTVTVILHDDGGTDNGGDDTSEPYEFTISVGPLLTIDDVEVNEDAGTATFTVTLSHSVGSSVTVDWQAQDNSATRPADYIPQSWVPGYQDGHWQPGYDVNSYLVEVGYWQNGYDVNTYWVESGYYQPGYNVNSYYVPVGYYQPGFDVESYWVEEGYWQPGFDVESYWVEEGYWQPGFDVNGYTDAENNWIDPFWVAGETPDSAWVNGYTSVPHWIVTGGHDSGDFWYEGETALPDVWVNGYTSNPHWIVTGGHNTGDFWFEGETAQPTVWVNGYSSNPHWIDQGSYWTGDFWSQGNETHPELWVNGYSYYEHWISTSHNEGGTWVAAESPDPAWSNGYTHNPHWIVTGSYWTGDFWSEGTETDPAWVNGYTSNPHWIDDGWVEGYFEDADSGTLTFAPGDTTETITVRIIDDLVIEDDETYFLQLSNVAGAFIFDNQGVGTILNDDNGAPVISAISDVTINEDHSTGPISFTIADDLTAAGDLLVTATSSNTALVANNQITLAGSGANRTISLMPAANAFGTTIITIEVEDSLGLISTRSFQLTVRSVNDAPSFTVGPNLHLAPLTGAIEFAGWATNISAGPENESNQTLTFSATNTNNALFDVQPTIDSTGKLTFTPAAANTDGGIATVHVTLTDTGGTTPGVNTVTHDFTITVDPLDPLVNSINWNALNQEMESELEPPAQSELDFHIRSITVTVTSGATSTVYDILAGEQPIAKPDGTITVTVEGVTPESPVTSLLRIFQGGIPFDTDELPEDYVVEHDFGSSAAGDYSVVYSNSSGGEDQYNFSVLSHPTLSLSLTGNSNEPITVVSGQTLHITGTVQGGSGHAIHYRTSPMYNGSYGGAPLVFEDWVHVSSNGSFDIAIEDLHAYSIPRQFDVTIEGPYATEQHVVHVTLQPESNADFNVTFVTTPSDTTEYHALVQDVLAGISISNNNPDDFGRLVRVNVNWNDGSDEFTGRLGMSMWHVYHDQEAADDEDYFENILSQTATITITDVLSNEELWSNVEVEATYDFHLPVEEYPAPFTFDK